MTKVIDEYNKGQGLKDHVTVKAVIVSRQDTYTKELALMSQKSSSADIYFTASNKISSFLPALDPISGVDSSNYFRVLTNALTIDGKLYALPTDVSIHFLYYRKDLVDALLSNKSDIAKYRALSEKILGQAIDPKDPAKGWSLNDYKVMSAYFTKATNPDSPTKYGTIIQAKNLLYNVPVWSDVLWGAGGDWLNGDSPSFDTKAGLEAVNLYADLYKNGWASPASAEAEYPETQAALQSGDVAMAIQWSAAYAQLMDPKQSPKVAGKIGIATVPGGFTSVHAEAVSLNKYSDHKVAATKFLKYLAKESVMTTYAKAGGMPAMPKVLEANVSINPSFGDVAEQIKDHGRTIPASVASFKTLTEVAADLSGAWVGQGDAESALKKADADLSDFLK